LLRGGTDEILLRLFSHMHLKDITNEKDPKTGKLISAPIGEGSIDLLGQFKALRQDKYDGTMTMEFDDPWPGWGSRVENTHKDLEGLLKIIKESA
jgi:sugar phosphate isomerase/epimerase